MATSRVDESTLFDALLKFLFRNCVPKFCFLVSGNIPHPQWCISIAIPTEKAIFEFRILCMLFRALLAISHPKVLFLETFHFFTRHPWRRQSSFRNPEHWIRMITPSPGDSSSQIFCQSSVIWFLEIFRIRNGASLWQRPRRRRFWNSEHWIRTTASSPGSSSQTFCQNVFVWFLKICHTQDVHFWHGTNGGSFSKVFLQTPCYLFSVIIPHTRRYVSHASAVEKGTIISKSNDFWEYFALLHMYKTIISKSKTEFFVFPEYAHVAI